MLHGLRCGILAAALALPMAALAQPSLPGGPPSLPGAPPGAPSGGPPPDPRAKQQRQAPQGAPQQAPGQPSMRAPGGGGPGLPSAPPQYQAQPRYVPGPGVPHGAPPPPRERRYVEPRHRWVAPPAIYLPPWRRYSYIVEDDCAWIGRRAIRTDSAYWWRRYEACRYYGYDIYEDY